MKKICIYGNPTIDLIYQDNYFMGERYGGGVYYSSLPFIQRGFSISVYGVYTPMLSTHPVSEFMFKRQFSTNTNIFKLIYRGNHRSLIVMDKSPPIYPWNIQDDQCYAIVNPVLGEIKASVVRDIAHRSILVALDIQGFVRNIVSNYIVNDPSPEVFEIMGYVDIVHMDLHESISLARGKDTLEFLKRLSNKYRKVVITVTNRLDPVILAIDGNVHRVDIGDETLVPDKTGAGDYFLGSLLYYFAATNDERESVIKAHEDTSKWLLTKNRGAQGLITTRHRVKNNQSL